MAQRDTIAAWSLHSDAAQNIARRGHSKPGEDVVRRSLGQAQHARPI